MPEFCHPVFQIFIPDSLAREVKRLKTSTDNSDDGESQLTTIDLIGLWKVTDLEHRNRTERSNLENEENILPQSVVVTLVALVVRHNRKVKDKLSADSCWGSTTSNEEPHLIGQLTLGENESDHLQESDSIDLPSLWLSLRMSDLDSLKTSLTVEHICMNCTMLVPQPGSVIFMQYDPTVLQHLCHPELKNSVLPDIVLQGFLVDRSPRLASEKDILISLLPNFKKSNKNIDQKSENSDFYSQEPEESKIMKRSLGIKQLIHLFCLIKKVVLFRFSRLEMMNVAAILILDLCLGLMFTSYLKGFPHLYSTLHSEIEKLLDVLLKLLNWLRGSPAGLKLNSALNSLLWRFFSYHLHLWANYIGILEPILSLILAVIIKAGCLGFTMQISLIKDLLSIATFHVYCLYIYATRLFCVQITTIKSLGRLFMGRKWNPLRNRVDHVLLSKSEMFLSAVGFTIGIFLAPTTIIYYAVFLCLRLPVLLLESALMYFVDLMNSCEIVTNILILTNSPQVSNEMYLRHVPDSMFTFRVCLLTTRKVLKFPDFGPSIAITLQKICEGKVLSH